jgi:hypothetical protein
MRRYSVQRWYGTECLARADLYDGRPDTAVARLEREWPRLAASGSLLEFFSGSRARFLRALSHLSHPAAATDRRRTGIARRELRRLKRRGSPWVLALADVFGGAAAATEGDAEGWRRALERGVTRFDELDMAGYASAARYRLGAFMGGDDGRTLMAEGVARLEESGVRKPSQFIATLLPDPPIPGARGTG